MQFDAMDWVFNPPKPPKEDPTLAYGLAEAIAVGECYADGAIRSNNGGRHLRGNVWVRDDQATRAEYYGWRKAGICQMQDDGTTLYIVYR